MKVIKRNGVIEEMAFDKITKRVKNMCVGLDETILDPQHIAKRTIESLYDGVTTSEIDNLISEIAASLVTKHPQYAKLSSNIAVSNLQKNTKVKFSAVMKDLVEYINPKTDKHSPLISQQLYDDVIKPNAKEIDAYIDYQRDFGYDIFGFKTLERSYLLKIDKKIAERPQHMLMRVSLGIHQGDLKNAFKTYDLMSKKFFTHATPTLFNAGTEKPQMSSCFLLDMEDDSIDGIFDTLKSCARISKSAGGIGLSIHDVRASGSFIAGTNGISNGIVPMLKVFNETARYVDQGGGKRKGSFAIYLEPWHADVLDFMELRKNHGKDEMRARDLFLAMWTPDLFMKRVKEDGMWSLMCPNESKGLADVYDETEQGEFTTLYEQYEADGKFVKQIKARDLWKRILTSQTETGTPYMLYKDAANRKSNQKNLGTIRSSNLCAEIVEFTNKNQIAVCNLASLSLPMFIKYDEHGTAYFDFELLAKVTRQVAYNLDVVIDRNWYPTDKAERSNNLHRPVGLGVQGLADVFMLLNLEFESEDALRLDAMIHEVIQFNAIWQSMEIAKTKGSYDSFDTSPIAEGIFQWQLWGLEEKDLSGLCDWRALRENILKYGLRNSLSTANMPTASTSQILGNNEAFEPYTSNIYTRRTLAGEHIIVNNHLIKELAELGIWNDDMRQKLMQSNGSIQNIEGIPNFIKGKYKTAYEMSMRNIINMSAARGPFICQSQSLNLFVSDVNDAKLTSMHFHAYESGLKTGMYYLRTKAAVDAIKFTLDAVNKQTTEAEQTTEDFATMVAAAKLAAESNNPDDCEMCGS